MSQSTRRAALDDPSAVPLPATFAGFRGFHAGQRIVVCGCGTSLSQFTQPDRYVTIGVNDVGRIFQPDYLVVVNHRRQFHGDRFHYVGTSRARALFTHLDLGVPHPNVVRFGLGRQGGTDVDEADRLPYTRNSPYVAVCLALYMGARRIGLIGVDFTEHHFFQTTGAHPLAREIGQIDAEYRRLVETWQARGVEICNLSPTSRLVSVPRAPLDTFGTDAVRTTPKPTAPDAAPRVFFVNYRFLSAGDVFTRGLRHAAETLKARSAEAYWDDPQLASKVRAFDPDLLFVVHGRRFVRSVRDLAPRTFSAVWLVDEPYEVDDTSAWSNRFDAVFLNDPATLDRHKNAHYLPVAFDPSVHFDAPGDRPHAVGFIGGYNSVREAMLLRQLDENLLSYVVGGPWRSPRLRAICRSSNISAEETAALYRQTRIVVNVFREQHHYNRQRIPGHSLNPRVYEALACGALVVSEHRPEAETAFPAMPLFTGADELVGHVRRLLEDRAAYDSALTACRAALEGHSYADRLRRVMEVIPPRPRAALDLVVPAVAAAGWTIAGAVHVAEAGDRIILRAGQGSSSGGEVGFASAESYDAVRLSFELQLERGSVFIAKLHQESQLDQTTNSYHLVLDDRRAYVAKHHTVLQTLTRPRGDTIRVELVWAGGMLRGRVNGQTIPDIVADALPAGYCFVGLNRGTATLRELRIEADAPEAGEVPKDTIAVGPGAVPSVAGFVTLDDGATIASEQSLADVELACDVTVDPGASVIFKLNQQSRDDGTTNSYHVLCKPDGSYLARHHCILTPITIRRDGVIRLRFRRAATRLQLFIDGEMLANFEDGELRGGHCIIGVTGGTARLDHVRLVPLGPEEIAVTLAVPAPARARTPPVRSRGAVASPILGVQPFKAMPKRHLIYHLWPAHGSVWRWNLEMLLERIELFNGRRVIGVMQDSTADDIAEVRARLAGHGCEIMEFANDPLGEVVTFPRLIDAVGSAEPNDVTFYGHAKGVKYREAISEPVRRWTEALYRTTLDDWPSVRAALDTHVLAGSFRRPGRARPHGNVGGWHFSGSFFWIRNSHLKAPGSGSVPRFYGGVEAWPGMHFPLTQSACLFLDNLDQLPLPYLDAFWRGTGEAALRRWQATRNPFAPPEDLVNPLPFEGHTTPRLEQRPNEMAWLLNNILGIEPTRILTIGARHGGFEWHLARTARAAGRDIDITTIEIDPGPEAMQSFEEIRERFGQRARLIKADSTSPDTRALVAGRYDAVMIDGDHSYRGARSDWELARSLGARLVAFHDVVDSDWHAFAKCCVSRLWAEIKASHATDELTSGNWGGAGIVMPGAPIRSTHP